MATAIKDKRIGSRVPGKPRVRPEHDLLGHVYDTIQTTVGVGNHHFVVVPTGVAAAVIAEKVAEVKAVVAAHYAAADSARPKAKARADRSAPSDEEVETDG